MSEEIYVAWPIEDEESDDPRCPLFDAQGNRCPGTVVYMERDTAAFVYRLWCSTEGNPSEGCAADGELVPSDDIPEDVHEWARGIGFVEGDEVKWASEDE